MGKVVYLRDKSLRPELARKKFRKEARPFYTLQEPVKGHWAGEIQSLHNI